MRVYNRNHSATYFADDDTDAGIADDDQASNAYPSFTLSTEFCIYVHASIMGALFIFAITRYTSKYIFCCSLIKI